ALFANVADVAFDPAGPRLVVGGRRLYTWDLATGARGYWGAGPSVFARLFAALGARARWVRAVDIAGGRLAWASAREPIIHLWDVAENREREPLPAAAAVTRLAFAPDGRHLAVAAGRHFALWDVPGRRRLADG